MPPRGEGGIVDRPRGKGPGYSADLIARLEAGMKRHHGRALGRWLDHVWTHRERVNGLIEDFVTAMQPADAYHGCIAAKFGLIYATGIIAVETGFLPWKANLPLRVVRRLYRRALTALQEGCPVEALVALRDALCDPAVFPDIGTTRELVLNDDRVAGFRFSRAEGEFVAIRQESLRAVLGKTTDPSALIGALAEAGVVEGGHGARRTAGQAAACAPHQPRQRLHRYEAALPRHESGRTRRLPGGGWPRSPRRGGCDRRGLKFDL